MRYSSSSVRHLHRDFDLDRPMVYGDYVRGYIRRVEGPLDGGDEDTLSMVWTEHAERLRSKYGSTMDR